MRKLRVRTFSDDIFSSCDYEISNNDFDSLIIAVQQTTLNKFNEGVLLFENLRENNRWAPFLVIYNKDNRQDMITNPVVLEAVSNKFKNSLNPMSLFSEIDCN